MDIKKFKETVRLKLKYITENLAYRHTAIAKLTIDVTSKIIGLLV